MKKYVTLFLLFSGCIVVFGQTEYDLSKLLQHKKMVIYNRNATLLQDKNRTGVTLDEKAGGGVAWLKNVKFSSGTIELDLRGKDLFQQSFIGIAFHGVNDSTYDAVYFRPFNFLSKDSVRKIHAVQYISHPQFTWKKLRDERNGIFEKGLIAPPNPNDWFHARIVLKGNVVTVYVNDDKEPSLTATKLNGRTIGNVALWVGEESGGDFSNLKISN